MKQFESCLAVQFERYIRYRQNLGYGIKTPKSQLAMFDRYLFEQQIEPQQLTAAFFLQLRHRLPWEPRTINRLFSTLRVFFCYQVRIGCCQENPLGDVPQLREWHYIPFVFSPAQIDQLLSCLCAAIRKKEPWYLHDYGRYLAIVLLARCGLRISEPLKLFCSHYRPGENTLYLAKTKFKKDRLIPLPQAVATEIDNYLQLRKALSGADRNPYLLAGRNLKGLQASQVRAAFHRAAAACSIVCKRKTLTATTFGAPIPHSLRHSFAINTLRRVREQGKSPQHALPVLAAYMGHSEYKHTLKYLKVLDAGQRQELFHFVSAQDLP